MQSTIAIKKMSHYKRPANVKAVLQYRNGVSRYA